MARSEGGQNFGVSSGLNPQQVAALLTFADSIATSQGATKEAFFVGLDRQQLDLLWEEVVSAGEGATKSADGAAATKNVNELPINPNFTQW